MGTKLTLLAALALATALPLAASHRHGRNCGHYYSSAQGGWVAVSVATPFGAGVFGRGYDRGPRYRRDGYYDRGYYRQGRYFRDKRAYKRFLKEQRKREKWLRKHRRDRYRSRRRRY